MNIYYCPLVLFRLTLDTSFKEEIISDEIKIVNKKEVPDLDILSEHLSPLSLTQHKHQVYYWLKLEGDYGYKEFKELIQIFQITLWIVKPTKTYVSFVSDFKANVVDRKFCNFLYRFGNIPNHSFYGYNETDLKQIKLFYPLVKKCYSINRLKTALVFNFNGSISNFWESTYILYVSAFETLLNHKSDWWIKKKLSWAFAILTESEEVKRQSAFDIFRDIYKIRSEILHGETSNDKYNDGELNLEELAKCRDMLRKLWQAILNSEKTINKLSGNDITRRDYFKINVNGWLPEESKVLPEEEKRRVKAEIEK